MINPLPVVWAEVRRSPTATIVAALLIAVAVGLGVAVTAQERALRSGTARAADAFDILIGARGSPTQLVLTAVYLQPAALDLLPGADLARLSAEHGVRWAAPLVFGDSYRGSLVVGTTAALLSMHGAEPVEPGRIFSALTEAVIGADVPMRLGERFAAAHGESGGGEAMERPIHHGFEYNVVGVMPRLGTPWDRAILVPAEAMWRLHGRPTGHLRGDERIGPPWEGEPGGVSAIAVKAVSVADAYRLRAKYRTAGTMAIFPAEVLVDLYATLGDARDLFALVALVTQVLVVAAVLLAAFATQAARRRQFGILRALGASRGYVFAAVWLHVTLLLTAGGVGGLALGWAAAAGVSRIVQLKTGVAMSALIGAPEVGLVAALLALGAVLALLPAWATYRQPVASLLRA